VVPVPVSPARSISSWTPSRTRSTQGDRDALTPPEPARVFFEDVTAPVKDFALIEDASHFASFRHPDRFLELMLDKVRPALGK